MLLKAKPQTFKYARQYKIRMEKKEEINQKVNNEHLHNSVKRVDNEHLHNSVKRVDKGSFPYPKKELKNSQNKVTFNISKENDFSNWYNKIVQKSRACRLKV